ncbi:MAG: ABC-type multidrug transport system ATPase subunit [Bradymonadia bacterium]|jgi:ABC-type multidrug transport system ATPase subunit
MLELIGVVLEGEGLGRLDRCSFEARAGEVLGLIGRTGAGKTAALAIAAGALTPGRGRIQLAGRDVSRRPAKLREACAWCRERLDGPFDITAAAWLDWWGRLDGIPDRAAAIKSVSARFKLDFANVLVGHLSRGQRRRLALARVWARPAKIRLLDAPSDGLDGSGLRRLTQAIRESTSAGETIILADSTPHLAVAVCDRVVLMKQGTVKAEASRSDADFGAQIAGAAGWATQ